MKTALFILSFAILAFSQCVFPNVPVTVTRQYSKFANEESFYIVEGEDVYGKHLLTVQGQNEDKDTVHSYELCLRSVVHTVVMKDTMGDGWGTALYPSTIKITSFGSEILSTTMPYTTGSIYKQDTAIFVPSFTVPSASTWKYIDEEQSGNSWSESTFDDQKWSSAVGTKMPTFTSGFRYYRTSIKVPTEVDKKGFLEVIFTQPAGCTLYINGQKVMTTKESDVSKYVRFSASRALYLSENELTIAIEVHAIKNTKDTFDAIVNIAPLTENSCKNMITYGSAQCYHACGKPVDCTNMFDNNDGTTSFIHGTGSIVYTFDNESREYAGSYSIGSASKQENDIKSWKLYGSNNKGNSWILLDTVEDNVFIQRRTEKTFNLPSNKISYNQYKLVVDSIYDSDKFEISEFKINACNSEILDGIYYENKEFTLYTDANIYKIKPRSTGYKNFSISPALPEGLTMSENGIIRGSPVEKSTKTYTISAVNALTETVEDSPVVFVVADCEMPNNAKVKIQKNNKDQSNTEKWAIYDESNVLIQQQIGGTADNVNDVFTVCHAAGNWRVTMTDETDGGWSPSSLLFIYLYRTTGETELINIGTLWTGYTVVHYINTKYSIYPGFTWKFIPETVPAGWYSSSFDDTTWTDYTDGTTNSGNHIFLFRGKFNVLTKTNYHGIDIQLKCRQAYVVYLNGVEVYRWNLPAGDITTASDPTISDVLANKYKQISYKLSAAVVGLNTLAVAVINKSGQTYGAVDFQGTLRLMSESAFFGHSYGLQQSSSAGSTGGLYDFRMDTNWKVLKTSPTYQWAAIAYADYRAGYINKYCLTNGATAPHQDPSDWNIYGSDDLETYTLLSTENNISWQQRNERQCFFIPLQSKPWRQIKIEVMETADKELVGNYIAIAEFEIMVEDLEALNPPAFSLTPNIITAYVGEYVPQMSESSEIYAKYRVSPALPYPLSMDTNNGRIHGIAATPLSATVFTVTAANHLGADVTTTFTLTIMECTTPNSIVTIVMKTQESGDMGWQLYEYNTQVLIDSRTDLAKYATLNYPLCKPTRLYDLVLTSKVATGWGSGSYEVYDSVGALIASGTVSPDEAPKKITISPGYLVEPTKTTWKLLNTNTQPASNWNTVSFSDSTWTDATVGALPVPNGQTQYYRKTFTISEDISGYSGVEITALTKVGIIAYVNGVEVLRSYMPTGTPTKDTVSTGERETATTLRHAISLANNPVVSGSNVLCIEVHHFTTIPQTNEFDASLRLLADNSYRVYGGVASGEPSKTGNEGDDMVWDNNVLTKTLKSGCEGATFQYTFDENRQELITAYEVFNANDCNSRHPSAWRLEASNDGNTWTVLHNAKNQIFTAFRQGKKFSFYNSVAYNRYRLYATECANQPALDSLSCGTGSIQLAEIRLFLSKVTISCPAQDGYSPAIEGTEAFKACAPYYGGTYSKPCVGGILGAESNDCKLMKPAGVSFTSTAYVLRTKTDIRITPVVQAAAYKCIISPALKAGLSLEETTGSIVGRIEEPFDFSTYTVTCTNDMGSASTDISLSAEAASGPGVWVYIVLAIALIIIVAVVAFCLYARLKGNNNKKKGHANLNKKKNPTTPTKDDKKKTVKI